MSGPDKQELRHSKSPIKYRVSRLGEHHDLSVSINYPSYIDIPYVHWGVLRIRPGNADQERERQEETRTINFNAQGQLLDIKFFDPELGVDIANLPQDDALPAKQKLENFFREHDIPLGRKAEH